MSDLPEDLDLKFLPAWLKEAPSTNRYANFEGEPERRDRDRGPRPPGGDRRGPRRDAPGGGRGPRPPGGGPNRGGPPRGGAPRGREGERRGPDRGARGARDFERERGPRPEPIKPAAVRVEFLPEPNAMTAIARQIRSGVRAYPLFGTARLFLVRPERYRVRITATEEGALLHQVDDGPISTDRAAVERDAFRGLQAQYYREEVVQTDPPKGIFSNVARVRSTGLVIGPTNYHSYQPSLRKIYEERYSRRMSFQEFQQHEIEIVTGEQAVNDWKEKARTTTTFVTTQEAEPITFKSAAEAEQHFRKTYLPNLVKSAQTLETSGPASHASGVPALNLALGDAWEKEHGFPASLVNHLRPVFVDAGLHFFKHRKRVIYVTPVRPQRHATGQSVSANISAILQAIEASPRLKRHDLAVKLLGENIDAEENAARKTALATDLHYLIHGGHVIEFADGTLDVPLPPKELAENQAGGGQRPQTGPKGATSAGAKAAPAGTQAVSPATPQDAEPHEQEITADSEAETAELAGAAAELAESAATAAGEPPDRTSAPREISGDAPFAEPGAAEPLLSNNEPEPSAPEAFSDPEPVATETSATPAPAPEPDNDHGAAAGEESAAFSAEPGADLINPAAATDPAPIEAAPAAFSAPSTAHVEESSTAESSTNFPPADPASELPQENTANDSAAEVEAPLTPEAAIEPAPIEAAPASVAPAADVSADSLENSSGERET